MYNSGFHAITFLILTLHELICDDNPGNILQNPEAPTF